MTPAEVLKFWFGEEFDQGAAAMGAEYMSRMQKRWFQSNPDFDEEVRGKGFPELIRAVAKGNMDAEWESENGKLARIVLFDQLSRNAFRGSSEAFEYDAAAVQLARTIRDKDVSAMPLEQALLQFSVMPLMHAESIEDQDLLQTKLEENMASSSEEMKKVVQGMMNFGAEHRDVILKFGRFPHRNGKYGRESTDEEKAWLASEECPVWAKSQG